MRKSDIIEKANRMLRENRNLKEMVRWRNARIKYLAPREVYLNAVITSMKLEKIKPKQCKNCGILYRNDEFTTFCHTCTTNKQKGLIK